VFGKCRSQRLGWSVIPATLHKTLDGFTFQLIGSGAGVARPGELPLASCQYFAELLL
jgi:hypothetical protein